MNILQMGRFNLLVASQRTRLGLDRVLRRGFTDRLKFGARFPGLALSFLCIICSHRSDHESLRDSSLILEKLSSGKLTMNFVAQLLHSNQNRLISY